MVLSQSRSRPWLARIAAGLVCGAFVTGAPHAQPPKTLALVGGMLLTGYDVPPVHHAAVLIEGNRIVASGLAAGVEIPADAVVIDTRGRTMLPGLIETHAHLIVLGHGNYATWFRWTNAHGGSTMLNAFGPDV
jgi:predicted amidohydrolase YtcJ